MRLSALRMSMLMPAAAVSAGGRIKPGLREITAMSYVFRDVPGIPPMQLEKMHRRGVPKLHGDTIAGKACITKEMAEWDGLPYLHQQQAGHENRDYRRSSNECFADIVCSGPFTGLTWRPSYPLAL